MAAATDNEGGFLEGLSFHQLPWDCIQQRFDGALTCTTAPVDATLEFYHYPQNEFSTFCPCCHRHLCFNWSATVRPSQAAKSLPPLKVCDHSHQWDVHKKGLVMESDKLITIVCFRIHYMVLLVYKTVNFFCQGN